MKESEYMKTKFTLVVGLAMGLLCNGCIENDVDYPYVGGVIEEFQVEGMARSAVINKSERTVAVEVSDDVDVQKLTITRLKVESNASVFPDQTKTIDPANFPEKGFASLDSIPATANTKINFATPVEFLLETYQEYTWTVTVTQELDQFFLFEENVQTKVERFDNETHQVYVFVEEGTDLSNLTINNVQFVSSVESVSPEPWTVTDFSDKVEFNVTVFGRLSTWTVHVIHDDEVGTEFTVYPHTQRAYISGSYRSGSDLVIEYRRRNGNWITVDSKDVEIQRNNFSVMITGLSPRQPYECRVTIAGEELEISSFTTAAAEKLTNGSFDDWHSVGTVYYPWARNGVQYWDTGNKGATTVGGPSNSSQDTYIEGLKGSSAKLESVYVFGVKLAAGNIFTGSYVRTDGVNGVLSFGRPFMSFPTKLGFYYDYRPVTIDKCDDKSSMQSYLQSLIGQMDSCHVYCALADWIEPWEIRTKVEERQLFEPNDPGIIAYGEFITGQTSNGYDYKEIDFEYRSYTRVPTYLVIVATSSRYGDYFTGGDGSTLWLDEMELIYD